MMKTCSKCDTSLPLNDMEHTRRAFMAAIDYALDPDTDCGDEFLRAWREGDWPTLVREWPDFDLSTARVCDPVGVDAVLSGPAAGA